MYLSVTIINIFPLNKPDPSSCTISRFIIAFIAITNFFQLNYIDYNLIILILIPILNSLYILYNQYAFDFSPFYFSFEFVANILYSLFSFFYKKYDLINKKKIFFEGFKNEQYMEYINQLLNVLSTIVISVKNKEVLFMNKFSINYFKKKKNFKIIEDIQEKEPLISYNSNNNNEQPISIHTYMNSFFASLILDLPFDNETLHFSQGKPLNEIISEISSSNIFESIEFTKIG